LEDLNKQIEEKKKRVEEEKRRENSAGQVKIFN